MAKITVTRPKDSDSKDSSFSLFLAGTIDMGNSRDWQTEFIETIEQISNELSENELAQEITKNLQIFNPRRLPGQGFDGKFNKEEMEYQVKWELDHLIKANAIIMNLLPDSKSPISLMELGLFKDKLNLWIICPPEYYRYDNVRIVCQNFGIRLFNSEPDFWKYFIEFLTKP